MTTETEKKASPTEVNIIQEYNKFAKEIPWADLQSLPAKLAPLKKWAGLVGIKDPNVIDSIDLHTPVRDVVMFLGVLVKRLQLAEREIAALKAAAAPESKTLEG